LIHVNLYQGKNFNGYDLAMFGGIKNFPADYADCRRKICVNERYPREKQIKISIPFSVLFIVFIEKVIPLIISDNKSRHIHNLYLPHSFHSQLFEIYNFHRFNIFGCEYSSGTPY
jgi:hypothetical protein